MSEGSSTNPIARTFADDLTRIAAEADAALGMQKGKAKNKRAVMTTAGRGSYAGARTRYKIERPANYFRLEHEGAGRYISWADVVDRGNGKLYASYKFADDRTLYRIPREKTVWFDERGIEFARLEIQRWKDANNNSAGFGRLSPTFYLAHRRDYLRWLKGQGNQHSTIQAYEAYLERDVFPFFVGKLRLTELKRWDAQSFRGWEAFLMTHVAMPVTRNRIRTGLRRYLRFLFTKGLIDLMPTILNEREIRDFTETPIPGELPEWKHVVEYFRLIPKGRMRFVKAVEVGFGVRVSEGLEVAEGDFFGAESEDFIDERNDFVRKVKDAGLGALFLNVDFARKRKVRPDIVKLLGGDEEDAAPKTGRYTACCTSTEMAKLILEMIREEEHVGEVSYEQVQNFRQQLPIDHSPYRFHEYRDHDYRRLQITLQTLDLDMDDRIGMCCYFHAHRGQEVYRRYFQWALLQRRQQGGGARRPLQVFETKQSRHG